MTKVRPNVASKAAAAGEAEEASAPVDAGPAEREEKALAVSLMVWRRSLLFNGKGFTVFDCKGNLIYRVESYAGGSSREVVLMDADGHGLLTIRRKKLSFSDEWLIYDGDTAASRLTSPAPKRFTARRHVSLRPSRSLAHLSPARASSFREDDNDAITPRCRYDVEGSYTGRCLDVFASSVSGVEQRQRAAAVCKKEAPVGPDVFCLVVEPGFDPALAMVVIILLDQMHAS